MIDALICGAAPEPRGERYYASLLAAARVVIAADAAAEWAVGLGRVPDVAVGDFDSAQPGAPERLTALGVEVVTFPSAKDESDLDLALSIASGRGARRVTFTATASRRLDHTIGALGVLMRAAALSTELAEPSLAAWPLDAEVRPSIELTGRPGALVSLFALDGPATGVTLTGMRFPLTDARVEPLSTLGLSNELESERAVIAVTTGRLLALAPGGPQDRARLVDGV
jgi:thiamine pyrophosphokinase